MGVKLHSAFPKQGAMLTRISDVFNYDPELPHITVALKESISLCKNMSCLKKVGTLISIFKTLFSFYRAQAVNISSLKYGGGGLEGPTER